MNKIEYLFTCLSEEAAEVIHCVGKIQRFGLADKWKEPDDTNDISLGKELCDLIAIVELLEENGITIPGFMVMAQAGLCRRNIESKKAKVLKYMEYSRECGTLDEEID